MIFHKLDNVIKYQSFSEIKCKFASKLRNIFLHPVPVYSITAQVDFLQVGESLAQQKR